MTLAAFPEAMVDAGKPRFFAKPGEFGAWLAKNGTTTPELVVGYWKVGSGKPSMTWAQSVEQALMHGWIDGVRRSLSAEAYSIRFTPRRKGSHWSAVNLRTAKRLVAEGRMAPAGLAAYQGRDVDKAGRYAYEQRRKAKLPPADVRAFKADAKAWAFYSGTAPSYHDLTAHWLASAKRPETHARRLAKLIAHSRAGKPVPPFVPRKGKGGPAERAKKKTAKKPSAGKSK